MNTPLDSIRTTEMASVRPTCMKQTHAPVTMATRRRTSGGSDDINARSDRHCRRLYRAISGHYWPTGARVEREISLPVPVSCDVDVVSRFEELVQLLRRKIWQNISLCGEIMKLCTLIEDPCRIIFRLRPTLKLPWWPPS